MLHPRTELQLTGRVAGRTRRSDSTAPSQPDKSWESRGDQSPERPGSDDRGQQLPGDGQRPDGNGTRCSDRRASTSMARLLPVVHRGEIPARSKTNYYITMLGAPHDDVGKHQRGAEIN